MLINISIAVFAILILQASLPTELPQVIVVLLGAIAPLVIQYVKGAFKERFTRLVVAVILSGGIGAVAFYMVNPEGLDLADTIAWVYAAAALAYDGFWKPIWQKFGFFGFRKS